MRGGPPRGYCGCAPWPAGGVTGAGAGTVAAAATGIAIEPTAIAPEPATRFTLDHPFLVFLRDDATGAVLFVAQVSDPA